MMEHHFYGILPKNVYFESNHEETSDKPNLRDILQNKPIPFKIVMVMKEKATQRNSSRLKDTKEAMITAVCDHRLDCGAKGISGATGEV